MLESNSKSRPVTESNPPIHGFQEESTATEEKIDIDDYLENYG